MGGTLKLRNVDITTAGNGAAAAISTDRGSGTIDVVGGNVKTTGFKSPGIYSTGKINVTGAIITATGSEAVVIEGKNSVTLNNTTISGAKQWGVFFYQSFSGDASVGMGSFTMNGGSLKSGEGPLFYSTNTNAVIRVKGPNLEAASGILMKAAADNWGIKGFNGANITFYADSAFLNGNIDCDNLSTIAMVLQNNTTFKGLIDKDNKANSLTLCLDKNSKWIVTGTSYLTNLTEADSTLFNIQDNGHNIYYDANAKANSWLEGKTFMLSHGGKLTARSERVKLHENP